MKTSRLFERFDQAMNEAMVNPIVYSNLKELKSRIVQDLINEGHPDPPPDVQLEVDTKAKIELPALYHYSAASKAALDSADPKLRRIFYEIIRHIDCSVLYGHRIKVQQEEMFRLGHTRLHYPKSLHNKIPSFAVDVVPYPIDWYDRERFVYFAGIVKGVASTMGIKIRWGGDWDKDNDLHDQTWMDLPHYELVEGYET